MAGKQRKKQIVGLEDVLGILGYGLLVGGVWQFSAAGGMIVAGLLLLMASIVMTLEKRNTPEAPKRPRIG